MRQTRQERIPAATGIARSVRPRRRVNGSKTASACTLSGHWGMYNGSELCEAGAQRGREEYIDSEKYEIPLWTGTGPALSRPRSLSAELARSAAPIRRSTAIAGSSSSTLSTEPYLTMRKALPTGAMHFWSRSTSIQGGRLKRNSRFRCGASACRTSRRSERTV